MTPYLINPRATHEWRTRVRALLVEQAVNGEPRERTAAARLFGDALRLPHGYFGQAVPAEVRDAWKPDVAATLTSIEEVAAQTTDGAVRIELIGALDWHTAHGPWSDISKRAADLTAALTEEEDEILAAVASPWSLLDDEERTARDERVARRLYDRFESGSDLMDFLEALVGQILERGMADSPEPNHVLFRVFTASLPHAEQAWEWVVEHTHARLASAGPVALSALRRAGREIDDKVELAAADADVVLRRVAAVYLSSGSWFGEPTPVELRLIELMAADDDRVVRDTIATALLRLRSSHPELAVKQALKARIEPDDQHAADMLFSTVHGYGLDRLQGDDVDQLCAQLIAVAEPEYFAHQAFADLGEVSPPRVIETWLGRLGQDTDEVSSRYRPVPFHDFGVEMLGSATGDERTALHAQLLDGISGLTGWRVRELGQIYWRLALPGISDEAPAEELIAERAEQLDAALVACETYASTPEADQALLGDVLFELPWQVLFARPHWVARLLECSEDPSGPIPEGLHAAGFTGIHGRSVGEDSPRWTATLAGAEAAVDEVAEGSVAAEFFANLARLAQREIDSDRREDEDERSGWQ